MRFYPSSFNKNIIIILIGTLLVVLPTASTNLLANNSYNFYPDLLLCYIFSTIFNRPNTLTLFSATLLLLLADILHMKPLGLFTMIVLGCFLLVKLFFNKIEISHFLIHYAIFFLIIILVQTLNIVIHSLFFIPTPDLYVVLKQAIFTLIFYPVFDIPFKLLQKPKK